MTQQKTIDRLSAVLIGVFCIAPVATSSAAIEDITFEDVALQAGFQDRLSHGRAIVSADFNKDGWLDYYLGNPGNADFQDHNFIYWNDGPDQNGDFHFTKGQVLLQGAIAFTASAADYDNDGDPDLFIGIGGQEGIGLDYLFRNDDGTFVDVSDQARVRGPSTPLGQQLPAATSSGTWADYDRDGFMDLFVAYRVKEQSLVLPNELGWKDALFRNNGDGTFSDVTDFAGIVGFDSSMSASWADYDNDGWMDIFVPHFSERFSVDGYQLYMNNQDGTFSMRQLDIEALQAGSVAYWASCATDFNNDGHMDVMNFGRFQANTPKHSHTLLINQGDATFTNEVRNAGLAGPGIRVPRTMGCQIGDLDNNGYPDIVIANGGPGAGEVDDLFFNVYSPETGLRFEDHSHLINYEALPDPGCVADANLAQQPDTLIDHDRMMPANPGDPNALDTSKMPMAGDDPFCNPPWPYRGHGVVVSDYDRDGDLDIGMSKGGTAIIAPGIPSVEPNRLFRNDGGNVGNWVYVELNGTASNRDGIGARIEVVSSNGTDSKTVYREVQGGTCFSASLPREQHIGLADHDRIDSIRIRWPSGVETLLLDQDINQRIVVEEEIVGISNFNDGDADGWTPISGDWGLIHGSLVQKAAGTTFALNPNGADSDYSVAAKLTYVSGQKNIGLHGRTSADGLSSYAAVLNDDSAQLFKSENGVMTALSEPVAIDPMTKRRTYMVSLRFVGDTIAMSVDGSAPVIVTDSSIASGSVGLSTKDTSAGFDNIIVY